ncbi:MULTISPECIES: metallophosphoesterase [Marinitoga]|uniref:metallophosphoesterase n=1 Tax=Marinitoga TaxID=160798 RepID=UPI0013E9F041|nr:MULTISPECIES: metallophosphoesterase [Marinitoga]KAF2955388.1 metallophosphatase [Marinitoga sp. 38H-ov]MBM7559024.1 putative phosphoesterase [Marinitoga litoralis]
MWLLISDTHDNIHKMKEVEKIIERENITAVFHCGDFVAPFVLPYIIKDGIDFYGVFGNNDGEKLLLSERSNRRILPGPREINIEGKKILMMHEPYALRAAEKSGLYDFVFFGHTHEIVSRKENGTVVVNPGEGSGWLSGRATIALIDPVDKEVNILEI